MFIIICKNYLFSQHNRILDNIFELNISLKMDFDSLKNLHLVKCSEEYLDSTTVTINGVINNLDTFSKEYTPLGCWHKKKIKTYLLDNKIGFIIFLNFYNNKLIEVAIFLNDSAKIVSLKHKLKSHFELKEYVYKGENKIEKFHFATYKDRYSYLVFSDKKASNLVPSWCGNDRKRGSWEKLDKYLANQK